jgi:hypothetical protein
VPSNQNKNEGEKVFCFIYKDIPTFKYLLGLTFDDVIKIAFAINNNIDSITIDGEKIRLNILSVYKFYEVTNQIYGTTIDAVKTEFRKDIKSTCSKFDDLLSRMDFFGKDVTKTIMNDNESNKQSFNEVGTSAKIKNGKIFISHSSKDKEIVSKFLNTILDNGLNLNIEEDVFCTSFIGSDIKSGEDFKNRIKKELIHAKAIIQFISQNYKESEICLNEMGAAWVLNDTVIPFIIEPDKYDIGFIHNTTQQLQLSNRTHILKFINENKGILFKKEINISKLDQLINEFIDFLKNHSSQNSLQKKEKGIKPIDKFSIASYLTTPNNTILKIENFKSNYIYNSDETREIPDVDTYVHLGFKKNPHINIKEEEFVKITQGNPLPRLKSCEVLVVEKDYWVIYEGKRKHVPDKETLNYFLKKSYENFKNPTKTTFEALSKIQESSALISINEGKILQHFR